MEQIAGDALERIRTAYDGLQTDRPAFGVPELGEGGARQRLDRLSSALVERFQTQLKTLSLLELGCSTGYLSLALAKHGIEVTGVDPDRGAVEFCRLAASAHGLRAEFRQASAREFLARAEDGEFDGVLLLDLPPELGPEEAVRLAREKVDFLVMTRRDSARLAGSGDLGMEVLLDGAAEEGRAWDEQILLVHSTTRHFNQRVHHNVAVRHSKNADGWTKRKDYSGDNLFTKCYVFHESYAGGYVKFISELSAYRQIGPRDNFLPLLGSEIRGKAGYLTVPRLAGPNLLELLMKGVRPQPLRGIALQLCRILNGFAEAGLYWNDFRTHNIAMEGERLFAIDLEAAHPLEVENTLALFLWMLCDLQSGRSLTHHSGVFKEAAAKGGRLHIARPDWSVEDYADPIRDIAAVATNSADLREFLSKARPLLA